MAIGLEYSDGRGSASPIPSELGVPLVQRGVQPPDELEAGALYQALGGDERPDRLALVRELGRQAAHDGWARRLVLDVARGRLRHSPYSVVDSLCELAKSAPALVVHLTESRDPSASLVAGNALGREWKSCEGILLSAAGSADDSVRLAAAAGLGEAAAAGYLRAAEALGRMLSDDSPAVRWSAAVNLGAARGEVAEFALSRLGEALASGDDLMVSGGVFGLARLWPERKREAAARLLRSATTSVSARRAAALAMRQLPRRAAARLAGLCLTDEDPDTRALCAGALGAWRGESAVARRDLMRLAGDSNATVRAAAAEVLASDAELAEESFIERIASDASAVVRAAVAEGMGRGGRSDLQEVLARLARDEAAPVRMAAMRGLTGPAAQGLLRDGCRDSEPGVRAAAASAFEPDTPEAEAILLDLTRDPDASVVRAAAQALGRFAEAGSGEAWERLVELAAVGTARSAAGEGIAGALDRDPHRAAEILWQLQMGDGLANLLARVARNASQWQVAELARTAGRALECDDGSLGEAIGDVAVTFQKVGKKGLAAALRWLAGGAHLEIAGLELTAADAPGKMGEPLARLARAAKGIAPLARASRPKTAEMRLSRALASLEELLAHEDQTPEWVLVRRVARGWRDMLHREAGGLRGSGVTAQLLSRTVLSGGRGRLVVRVENLGREPATDLVVRIGGTEAHTRDLAAGESCEVEMPHAMEHGGHASVRGAVSFRLRGAATATRFEGAVKAVSPRPLGTVANPYVVGKPLVPDSAMFFGRSREMEHVERGLRAGQEGSVIVLVGPRRIGKTSLLKRVGARLSYAYRCAYIDVQGMLVSDTEDFFRELARAAVRDSVEACLPDGDMQLRARGPDMVREAAALCDRPLVLLLDEFDDLDEKVRRGRLSAEVFDCLRNLVQHSENVRLALSGTHRLEELGGDHWSFLLNLATYRRIGCLKPEEAERVLTEPLSRLGIAWEEAALLRALRLAGGHPYFLQLVGYRLVEGCVASGEGGVGAASVEEAAEEVIEQGDIHLRYLWESAGEEGRALLQALAEREGGMTEEQLRAGLGLGSGSVRKLLKRLTAAELVVGRESKYALRMSLLSRWLQRARPGNWKVS